MPLPLTISCSSKIQIGFTCLVPAHLGSPGQRAVKGVCGACMRACMCVMLNFKKTLHNPQKNSTKYLVKLLANTENWPINKSWENRTRREKCNEPEGVVAAAGPNAARCQWQKLEDADRQSSQSLAAVRQWCQNTSNRSWAVDHQADSAVHRDVLSPAPATAPANAKLSPEH